MLAGREFTVQGRGFTSRLWVDGEAEVEDLGVLGRGGNPSPRRPQSSLSPEPLALNPKP